MDIHEVFGIAIVYHATFDSDSKQRTLIPDSIDDLIGQGNPVRMSGAFADGLDMEVLRIFVNIALLKLVFWISYRKNKNLPFSFFNAVQYSKIADKKLAISFTVICTCFS